MAAIGDNHAGHLREISRQLDDIEHEKAALGHRSSALYKQAKEHGVSPKAFRAARAAIQRDKGVEPELAEEIEAIRAALDPDAAAGLKIPPFLDRRPEFKAEADNQLKALRQDARAAQEDAAAQVMQKAVDDLPPPDNEKDWP